MGDWWNPVDDLRRLQQGVQTLEDIGEVIAKVSAFLVEEGIEGIEHLPDLVRYFLQVGEDPTVEIPKLVDRIRRVGGDVATILEALAVGIVTYGPEEFGRRLIKRVIFDPIEESLGATTNKAQQIATHLQTTVQGVSNLLTPLYGHALPAGLDAPLIGTTLADPVPARRGFLGRKTAPSAPAGVSGGHPFSGSLADTVAGTFLETLQATKGLTSTLEIGGPGYTWQQAVTDSLQEVHDTAPWVGLILVVVDLLILAANLGGEAAIAAATAGVGSVALPAVLGAAFAEMDATDQAIVAIWLAYEFLKLLERLGLALVAAIEAAHAAATVATSGSHEWVMPDGRPLPDDLADIAKKLWAKFETLIPGLTKLMLAWLVCHYGDEALALLERWSAPLELTGRKTIQDIFDKLFSSKINEAQEAVRLIKAIMMIGPQNIRGLSVRYRDANRIDRDIDIVAVAPLPPGVQGPEQALFIEVGGFTKGSNTGTPPTELQQTEAQLTQLKVRAASRGAIAQFYLDTPTGDRSSAPGAWAQFDAVYNLAVSILGADNVKIMPPLPVQPGC